MSEVRKNMVSGVAYTALAKYSGLAVSLIVTAVLARILSPEQFGTVAIATVIIAFFAIFCDMGIGPAIIQNQNLSKDDLSHIFTFTFWMGIFLSLCFFFCSFLIGRYYQDPILVPICQLLSINLFFSSLDIVPGALLYKNKLFKYIAIRTFCVQLIAGTMAVIAALSGLGIYSLLFNPIISSIVLFIISFIKFPQKFHLRLDFSALKKIFTFSAFQFFFNIINYFSRNLDKLIIGKKLGNVSLGYYEKSYRLMMLPLQTITQVASPVMLPVFSEFQNDKSLLARSYLKVVRLLALIGLPLSILLFFTSKELILIVFGHQWLPSITPFKILSLSVGLQIILSTSGAIFQAAGSTKHLFLSGVLSTTIDIIAICVGVFYFKSIDAVALFLTLSILINFIQCYILLFPFTLKQRLSLFVKELISPLCLALIIFIPLFALSFVTEDMNIILSLLIKSALAGIIWISYVQLRKEYDILGKMRQIFIKITKKRSHDTSTNH